MKNSVFKVSTNGRTLLLYWFGANVHISNYENPERATAAAQMLRLFLESWVSVDGVPVGPAVAFALAFGLKVPEPVTAEPAKEVTSAELQDAVVAKMQMLGPLHGVEAAAEKICDIIRSYGAMDILQIPQDKRAEFIERVKAVT